MRSTLNNKNSQVKSNNVSQSQSQSQQQSQQQVVQSTNTSSLSSSTNYVTLEEAKIIANNVSKTIVLEESNAIKSSINRFISLFTASYNKGIDVINYTPTAIHDSTMKVTNKIGEKLFEIGEAIRGKDDGETKEEKNKMTLVLKKHYDLLEKMRKQDIVKYQKLLKLSTTLKDASPVVQATKLKAFFN